MNYYELKELAKRANRARDEESNQLVDKLIKELPKLDLARASARRQFD